MNYKNKYEDRSAVASIPRVLSLALQVREIAGYFGRAIVEHHNYNLNEVGSNPTSADVFVCVLKLLIFIPSDNRKL